MTHDERTPTVIVNDLAALRQRSGVGFYVAELLQAFRRRQPEISVTPLSETLVGRPLAAASRLYSSSQRVGAARKSASSLGSLAGAAVGLAKAAGAAALERYLALAARLYPHAVYHEPDTCPTSPAARTIVTVQDLSVVLHPEWHPPHRVRKYERQFTAGVRQARRLLTSSESVRQELIAHFDLMPERVEVVPLAPRPHFRPLPAETVVEVRKRLDLPKRFLLFVGTIEPRKNVEALLHAYAGLPAPLRNRFPLVLAGGWGWRSERVRDMLSRPPWADSVRWLGYVDDADLVAVVNSASLLAYPSLYEGFGLPPLEAMACGTPVISSHAGGLRDAVGDAAEIVDPHDASSIAISLENVLDDPERAAELRRAGFARASQFSWDRTADRTADAYRRAA